MFKKLVLFTVVFASFSASASTNDWSFGSFFSTAFDFFDAVIEFITTGIPSFIDRLFAYLIEFVMLMKVMILMSSIETAFNVAQLILSDFGIVQLVEKFAMSMPADIRNAAVDMKIFQGLNLIIEAYMARFVLSMM